MREDSDVRICCCFRQGGGEVMPLSVLESLARGTPVVASDLSSLPEAVNDEVGRLCAVDDTYAFVSTIRDAISDLGHA